MRMVEMSILRMNFALFEDLIGGDVNSSFEFCIV
jgi:hypothetical protein